MVTNGYLIFSLQQLRYGIEASVVQEIFFLPELTVVPALSDDLVGVINLRGELLPVVDLAIRLGTSQKRYTITDIVIVLKFQSIKLGIIVNQVQEVQMIASEAIKTELASNLQTELNHGRKSDYMQGITQLDDHLVMILNPKTLIQYQGNSLNGFNLNPGFEKNGINPIDLEAKNFDSYSQANFVEHFVFCPEATPEERSIFQERAKNLRRSLESKEFTGLIPLAIVGLNQEYFGVNLEIIREFTDIHNVTPIPCTPPHIVGNMNLRGEIVTLVDLRGLVNLPLQYSIPLSKAMIVRVNDVVAGILVEGIFDVIYLKESEVKKIPTAVHIKQDEYLQGTAFYQDKMISILNVTKIVIQGELVIDEEV